MVAESLVTEMIDEGQRVIDALRANKFPVVGAFWLHVSQEEGWFLYLASPELDRCTLGEAHLKYAKITHRMVDLRIRDAVRLIGAADPITRDVLRVSQIYPPDKPVRYRGKLLGQLIVDDAYFYALTP